MVARACFIAAWALIIGGLILGQVAAETARAVLLVAAGAMLILSAATNLGASGPPGPRAPSPAVINAVAVFLGVVCLGGATASLV